MTRTIIGLAAAFVLAAALPAAAQHTSGARVPLVQDDSTDPDVQATSRSCTSAAPRRSTCTASMPTRRKSRARSRRRRKALRNDAMVPRADRELIILRATQLAHGDYQHEEHRPIAMSCGISAAQIDGLAQWRDNKLFDERQRAILAYADGMVSADGVDDATFAAMKRFFDARDRRDHDERRVLQRQLADQPRARRHRGRQSAEDAATEPASSGHTRCVKMTAIMT